MKHRKDIDGLRSIAVIPVVLFHAGLSLFRGGFVGVDVFFVISGFLITSILLREMQDGTYSLAKFYQRRVLRIFPALLAVLLLSSLAALFILLPNELVDYGKSLTAAVLFYSNEYYRRTTGYFEGSAFSRPLLHTWSLAVEEQFYIFFPIFLYLVIKFVKRYTVALIVVLIVLSFAMNVVVTKLNASFAFYLLPTRFWELALGSLIAAKGVPTISSVKVRTVVAAAGGLSLLFAIFFLSEDKPFPGFNALYPCLGAAAIIAYADETVVARILAWKPFEAVGLISYSLYLWHWPIIAFLRLQTGRDLTPGLAFAAVNLALALSVFSYYYIEQPFRARKYRGLAPAPVLRVATVCLLLFTGAGLALSKLGFSVRKFPDDVVKISQFENYDKTDENKYQFRDGTCMISTGQKFGQYDRKTCLPFVTGQKNFLVMGDSHSGHIWRALSEAYPDAAFSQASGTGCLPFLGGHGDGECLAMMNFLFKEYLPGHRYDVVFLAGRWKDRQIDELIPTIRYLQKFAKKVVILGPVPEYDDDLPRLLARSMLQGVGSVQNMMDPDRRKLDLKMKTLVAQTSASYISMYDIICPPDNGGQCQTLTQNGVPMQFDTSHLTFAGAKIVANEIRRELPL